MQPHDIKTLMATEPHFTVEEDDGTARFWSPAAFNDGHTWVGSFTGASPWELHPDSDELVHVLEGESVITLLSADGPVETVVGAGSFVVVPKGVWHRQASAGGVTMFGVTPGRTDHSEADDPRAG
jgi:mannose-6-phosphate isomerase-like protein (cupin superfamily)